MTARRLYPRATVRRIVKAHSGRTISKNADILVFLDYTLFIQDLMEEATLEAKKSGSKKITAAEIHKASKKSLMRFKC